MTKIIDHDLHEKAVASAHNDCIMHPYVDAPGEFLESASGQVHLVHEEAMRVKDRMDEVFRGESSNPPREIGPEQRALVFRWHQLATMHGIQRTLSEDGVAVVFGDDLMRPKGDEHHPNLNVERLMNLLADDRPIFHAEADFQHALAWQIREEFPGIDIRLEVDVSSDDAKRHYLDIWLPSQGVAIELKYATRNLELEVRGELFKLRNQMA